ncbi:hypothetical protein DEU56DRAFT_945524 [Suillus clintonianus]|uniref:uncharacterized protein n=2 Tax=Suillus clintonianus TaxID=1904413 RepID=UPI001B86A883|nr:uncharacterized protein DEU56DRAFT_945524 [Suillus clintonianus]KAG2138392.1 hypothetical protein DEU56DRAFT_945524 [Suillus clintonianus]
MPFQFESDSALVLAETNLRHDIKRIIVFQSDGSVSVDRSHDVARKVSQALKDHGRNASVIPPFLLSVAAEVRDTMNKSIAPDWKRVRDDDPRIHSHPFFAKTVGYVKGGKPATGPPSKKLSVPPIDILPTAPPPTTSVAPEPTADKGKRPVRETRKRRSDSPVAAPRSKKPKVPKPKSKALLTDTEDDADLPTGTVIVTKKSTNAAPAPKQADEKIARTLAKGKGKEEEKEVAKPTRGRQMAKADEDKHDDEDQNEDEDEDANTKADPKADPNAETYNPPCKRCGTAPCLVYVGKTGQVAKACTRCHIMKVKCDRPVSSRPARASRSRVRSRNTRATSSVRAATPIVESEEDGIPIDAPVAAAADIDVEMSAETAPQEPIVLDEPRVLASAADFPAEHWQEPDADAAPIPIPPPTPSADLPSLPSASSLPTNAEIYQMVLGLTSRLDAMENDFETRIASMRAEMSQLQYEFAFSAETVRGLSGMVEQVRQERVAMNHVFPPPRMSHIGGSTASQLGRRYLPSVFGPSVPPTGQSSASAMVGRPDMQGGTFTSGQAEMESTIAGSSSVPGQAGADVSSSSPVSAARSLP